MIPKVKDWRVTFYKADGTIYKTTVVTTITKRFARWFATEECGFPIAMGHAEKVTVSLVRS